MISEVNGNIFDYIQQHAKECSKPIWAVLPINYSVAPSGMAIMGAGLAKQYVSLYGLAQGYILGCLIQCNPTVPRVLPLGINGSAFWWACPTKHEPQQDSTKEIIQSSLWELSLYYQRQVRKPVIVLPRLGCGCGKLQWRHVKPTIESELAKVEEVVVCHLSTMRE